MSDSERLDRLSANKRIEDTFTETTSDEGADDWSESDSARDRWLRDNVPPHHG